MTIALEPVTSALVFSGEVRPKVESRLGFRVNGKIVARLVEVGTPVKRGQALMRLDPQDLALAQVQAHAGMTAAESNRDLAKAELKRYQELKEKNFVAATVLDSKETAYKAAQASYEQSVAVYKNQLNQSSYTSLVADADGVVTSVDAEVGQVVAAGTPVIRVAQTSDIDVVVGIPEDKVSTIRQLTDVSVRLWANKGEAIPAKLRELSPIADPVTRTFTAKLALPTAQKDLKLGMTASATFALKDAPTAIKLPLTALFQEKNVTSVWLVESGVVRLVPIVISGSSGQSVLVGAGLSVGQVVVTAGVHQLKVGQKVSILGEEATSNSSSAKANPDEEKKSKEAQDAAAATTNSTQGAPK
ncbi:MAG: efflux RND transporter periplasmic adaptor subunit [Burkholderiaceae bacterium]|nr:efflux RND transporter periplasmic adaptor subunit [Burkholderiaceae bacterium]